MSCNLTPKVRHKPKLLASSASIHPATLTLEDPRSCQGPIALARLYWQGVPHLLHTFPLITQLSTPADSQVGHLTPGT